jgi:hypothetical protein
VNIRGEVVAGLRLDEVEVTGGSLPFTSDAVLHLRVPQPQLVGTYPDFTSIETGFSSNLFTSNPDEEKTQLREGLVEDAIASAMRDAASPEAITWAEQCVVDALTRLCRLIGYSHVEVSLEDSAIRTETGSSPMTTQGGQEEAMPSASVSNRAVFLVLAAAAVVGSIVIPRLNLAELFRNPTATSVNSADNASSAESVLLRGLQRMASIGCGNYTGAAYVTETVPLRLLGIRLSDATVWLHAPGTARASVDLTGLTQADVQVRSTHSGRAVTISRVPPPGITGCEIDLARTVRGRTPFLPWGGNSRAVADAGDRLMEAAQDSIREQALRAGLLRQALENARASIANLIRQILGASTEVEINFGCPPEHQETSPWEIGLCDASSIRGTRAIHR